MVKGRKSVVKNTTFIGFGSGFDLISPLLCRGCGMRGEVLCECCKKYILDNVTRRKIEDFERKVFQKADYLGFRDEILGELVEEYKYSSVREIGEVLAEIIVKGYFEREEEVILVPMPTSRRHIKERGFDHIGLIAREIERLTRGEAEVWRLLKRAKDTVQVGADEETRRKQAKEAVLVDDSLLEELFRKKGRKVKVVLFDDVWTTGASLTEAGRMLKKAGIKNLRALALVKNRQGRSPEIFSGKFI
ncbi:ComF family protein [Candidatus Saccharibacteria bacterium]|nr:ComF family protein [Candidatus Saccharibacteria bacterium]